MKSEYDWLLEFYLQLVSFDVVTSTFQKLSKDDRDKIIENINRTKETFEQILPKIQDIG